MPVKDSRGSGAIVEFLILALVFSSLKDRSSPRDPLVSHCEEPPGASPRKQRDESIFLLISITGQFLLARADPSEGRFVPSAIDPLDVERTAARILAGALAQHAPFTSH